MATAKTYDFRVTTRKVEYQGNHAAIPYGKSEYVLKETLHNCTLAVAKQVMQDQAGEFENADTVTILNMRYRDMPKARGINAVTSIYTQRS